MAFPVSPGVNVSEIDLTTTVPAVATTTGAIAGVFNWGPVNDRILVDSELTLRTQFGKPDANNYETWMSAANFLSYGNSLYVVRAANTTSTNTAIGAFNAIANTGAVAVANVVVLNNTDFQEKDATGFESGVEFVARWPGDIGNSLRVSVCDTTSIYSSTLQANGLASDLTLDVVANLAITVGQTNATISVIPGGGGSAADANNYCHALVNTAAGGIAVGDVVALGNTGIGVQYNQVTAISAITANATGGFVTLTFADPYRLSTNYTTNGTVNSTISRQWEFTQLVGAAPQNSDYVAQIGGNTSVVDTMSVVVVDEKGKFTGVPGTVLETYVNVSRATDAKTVSGAANYWRTVINQNSRYVWAVNDLPNAASNTAVDVADSTNTTAYNQQFVEGTSGYTEANAPVSILATAYDLYAQTEDVDISLLIQGKPTGGTTTVGGMTVENFQLANYLIQSIAEARKDCVVFITPDRDIVTSNAGNEAQALVNWRNAVVSSSYAVLDSGYKYQYDRYNDVYRYVPTNGDIAGLCATTDSTRDPWYSPAGFARGQIKNVVKLAYNPSTQAARDLLYKNGINPIVTFPGQGTILYGDKTLLAKPSAFDRINVRRLFIVLEKAIQEVAKTFLFEFNDEFTQAQFRNVINPYLRDIQGRRGITDYLVVCDATNNTPQVVDSNQFVGDIYIKPERSINFIQLNFVAVNTGVEFQEIVGQF